MREGFSLIELLVVIAIIGILAAVGVLGYQSYIEETKNEVLLTNGERVARAFGHDVTVISEKMGDGRTALATDQDNIIQSDSDCIEYVAAAVATLNDTHQNPFSEETPYAVSLHKEAEWATGGAAVGTGGEARSIPLNIAKIKRGQLGLQCANACQSIDATNFYVHRCTCVGEGGCALHTFRQGDGSSETSRYESEVATDDRWDSSGQILIGAHLPEWVCPRPQDEGSMCP